MLMRWEADDPKQSIEERIAEGRDAYIRQNCVPPTLVLINKDELSENDIDEIKLKVRVVASQTVRRGMYWLCG